MDPRNADLQFHLGRCLLRMGRATDAREAFQRAVDEDVCALRITTPLRQAIRRVSERRGVPVLDAQRLLQAKAGMPVSPPLPFSVLPVTVH